MIYITEITESPHFEISVESGDFGDLNHRNHRIAAFLGGIPVKRGDFGDFCDLNRRNHRIAAFFVSISVKSGDFGAFLDISAKSGDFGDFGDFGDSGTHRPLATETPEMFATSWESVADPPQPRNAFIHRVCGGRRFR